MVCVQLPSLGNRFSSLRTKGINARLAITGNTLSRVDDILAAVPLLAMIEPGSLRSVGRDRYRGRCPVQKHQSLNTFSVARHENGHDVWQCFACGKRGSVIDLLAALDGLTIGEAIRKLSTKNLPELSENAILQKIHDSIERSYAKFAVLACDTPRCDSLLPLDSLLDFVLAVASQPGGWGIGSDGSVRCGRCNIRRRQCQRKSQTHGNQSNATQFER